MEETNLDDCPLTLEAAIDRKAKGYVQMCWHDWEMLLSIKDARERAKLLSVMATLASQETAFFLHYVGNQDVEVACLALRKEVLPDPMPSDLKLVRLEGDWRTYVILEIKDKVAFRFSAVEAYALAAHMTRCAEFAELMAFMMPFLITEKEWDEEQVGKFLHDCILARHRWDLEKAHQEDNEPGDFSNLLILSQKEALEWKKGQEAEEEQPVDNESLEVKFKETLARMGLDKDVAVKAIAYAPNAYERLILVIRGCQILMESMPAEEKIPMSEPLKKILTVLPDWRKDSLIAFCQNLLAIKSE